MAGILTLAMIKPHIYMSKKSGEIINRIEKEGFGIIQSKITQFQIGGAEEFYIEHKEKDFFPNLVQVMSAAPVWILVLSKPHAVQAWRDLIGDTDPAKAAKETLRNKYGDHNNLTNNAVHGSITDHEAKREINFFFARELKVAQRIYEANENSEPLQEQIRKALGVKV